MAGGAGRHITIAGRTFALDGENDINKTLSGYTNEVKVNGDTVTSRLVKTPKIGMLENVPVVIDPIRQDLEFLQGIADDNDFVDVDLTEVDGTIYSGLMQIQGDVKMSNKESICELALAGTLEQQ